MHHKSVKVPNISCGHCVRTIETELNALDHIVSVKVDEGTKRVDISWNDPQIWENIKTVLIDINYPAEEN